MNSKRVTEKKRVLRAIARVEEETNHLIHVADVILKHMQPLGAKATIVLTPKSYNYAHFASSFLHINTKKHVQPNGIFFIPKDELEYVTVTHGAEVVEEEKTTYYYWNGVRLLDKSYTAETTALGIFFNDPRKAR